MKVLRDGWYDGKDGGSCIKLELDVSSAKTSLQAGASASSLMVHTGCSGANSSNWLLVSFTFLVTVAHGTHFHVCVVTDHFHFFKKEEKKAHNKRGPCFSFLVFLLPGDPCIKPNSRFLIVPRE